MIAIVVPSLGDVDLLWAISLAQVVRSTSQDVTIFTSKHYRIDWARNMAVIEALKLRPSHILFWDSDIIPTLDDKVFVKAIDYMLDFCYPVVSGIYYTSKLIPNCFKYVGGDDIFLPLNLEEVRGKQFFCDGVGLGFCLVDARVFSLIEPPWFEYRVELRREDGGYSIREMSEDLVFCLKLREHGFKILCLGELFCKHIHKFSIDSPNRLEIIPTR